MSFRILILVVLAAAIFSCKSTKESSDETGSKQTEIPAQFMGKILATLMPDYTVNEVEADFAKYGLKHKSVASKSQNQHLFEFNLDKISAEDLIKKLNKSKKIYLAEAIASQIGKAEHLQSAPKKRIDIK